MKYWYELISCDPNKPDMLNTEHHLGLIYQNAIIFVDVHKSPNEIRGYTLDDGSPHWWLDKGQIKPFKPETREQLDAKIKEIYTMAESKGFEVDEELIKQMVSDFPFGEEKKEPEPEPEPPKEPRKIEIPKGHKAYSELFGIESESGLDHAVRVFERSDWGDMQVHVPQPDKNYVFPPQTERVVYALMTGEPCFIHGPKGSGKSSLYKEIAARMNLPWIRVNCRQDMESSALFGSINVRDGTMEWIPGPVEECARKGGIIQIDEISATPPGINLSLQWALENDGAVYLADKPAESGEKMITPHEWFRIVATDNTELQGDISGTYVGSQVQNEAMIDRFGTTVRLGYLDEEHERAIIKGHVPGIEDTLVKRMIQFAGLVRQSYESGNVMFTMSPRALVSWAEKAVYWEDPIISLRMAWFDKLIKEDQDEMEQAVYKVFGREIG